MKRRKAGLVGALAGLAAMGGASAQAASHTGAMPPEPMQITSYSDLLRPVPNAVELLRAHDALLRARAGEMQARGMNVQYYEGDDHHHHHHHHQDYYPPPPPDYYPPPPPPPVYYPPPPPPEHHHHHQGGVMIVVPGLGIQLN